MALTFRNLFLLVIFISAMIFLFSLLVLLFEGEGTYLPFLFYAVLFVLLLFLFVLRRILYPLKKAIISEFRKTLRGGLYHFKCLHCHQVFALKESMYREKTSILMNCPICGKIGKVPSSPPLIVGLIPKVKSDKIIFQCIQCKESVNIWAEGAPISEEIKIYNCPFCGWNEPMKRI